MTLLPKELASKLPHLLLGGGMGAGATIAYVLAEREPRALIETFQHWGAPSLIGLVAVVLLSQASTKVMDLGGQMLEVGRENAAAQQKLADAVSQISQKDDERAREMELVVDHLARNSRQILDDIREIKLQLTSNAGGKADAHTAG